MPGKQQKLSNPGGPDLNQYLHSSRPANWLILTLVLLLILMVVIWSFLGTMKTTVSVTGIHEDGHFIGFLMPKDALSLEPGMDMDYNGDTVGILTYRDTMALTAQETAEVIANTYYLSQIALNEYNLTIQADIDPNRCPEGVVTLEIVVGETRPFDFLMN